MKNIRVKKKYLWFYFFIFPSLIGFAVFMAYPVIRSLYLSFTDMVLIRPEEVRWIGFRNYLNLLNRKDPLFWTALKNTFIFALFNVAGTILLALFTAMLLNVKVKGKGGFRTVFFIPSLLPPVACAIMFLWLFDPPNGIINSILRGIGVKKPPIWLQSANTALTTLITISFYGFGGKMIIFLAGLNNLPASYFEAAEIDGATPVSKFFRITLPLLSPILFYNTLMGTIGALQVFSEGFVISGSGPGNSTLFYVLRMYNLAYKQPYRLGQASAMAWLLFIVIGILTLIYFIISKKFVFYQDQE